MNLYNIIRDSILSIKPDKRNDVFLWGSDNLFPNTVETLVNQSVTSKLCVDMVSKSIYGKSFGEIGNIVVNVEGQTLNEVLRIASRELSKHNNVFIHFGYNAEMKVKSIKVLNTSHCRVGKSDDLGYSGKIIYYDNWNRDNGQIKKENFKYYDRYNSQENVLKAQIIAAGGILKYKGQVLQLKGDSNLVYGLTDLNTVLHEALLESNSQKFRANGSERGFLSTKLMVVQPFSKEEERNAFKRTLKELQGAENAGNVLLLESSNMSDDLSSQIKLEDLTSPYNDELFKYSDEMAEKNICKAFSVPVMLVNSSDSGLFGNSGELIKQGKMILWESQEEMRDMVEETFNKIMKNWKEPMNVDLKIISPFEEIKQEPINQEPIV